jgi:hypothetical protein
LALRTNIFEFNPFEDAVETKDYITFLAFLRLDNNILTNDAQEVSLYSVALSFGEGILR